MWRRFPTSDPLQKTFASLYPPCGRLCGLASHIVGALAPRSALFADKFPLSSISPMITDTELKVSGLNILSKELGLVEAERFITLILRALFDYTAWSKDLFDGMSVKELSQRAMEQQGAKTE